MGMVFGVRCSMTVFVTLQFWFGAVSDFDSRFEEIPIVTGACLLVASFQSHTRPTPDHEAASCKGGRGVGGCWELVAFPISHPANVVLNGFPPPFEIAPSLTPFFLKVLIDTSFMSFAVCFVTDTRNRVSAAAPTAGHGFPAAFSSLNFTGANVLNLEFDCQATLTHTPPHARVQGRDQLEIL